MNCRCNRRSLHRVERGVTLLELLIAIALLLAMAAAVGPTVLSALDEREFTSVIDVTGRQMMLARAHAQASGQTVEVVYLPGTDANSPQVIARLFTVDEEDQGEALVQAWAERTLPRTYLILDVEPGANEQRIGGVQVQAAMPATPLRLGVFLPDGSAMAGSPRWLSDGDGRAARLSINPYSGQVQFTRLPPEDLREAGGGLEEDLTEVAQWELP